MASPHLYPPRPAGPRGVSFPGGGFPRAAAVGVPLTNKTVGRGRPFVKQTLCWSAIPPVLVRAVQPRPFFRLPPSFRAASGYLLRRSSTSSQNLSYVTLWTLRE